MVEEGLWGDWNERQDAPSGFFLCGFVFSEENYDGNIGVDGLKAVFCNSQNWADQIKKQLNSAHNKNWATKLCPSNQFINSIRVRFLSY
jgi:hypothetical protein